ncbi:unnamed protein product [Adineta ricciae]|uniref:Thioredoxin domain-containing protein n=1 Tax=Adineta ricciae TaxID=249248 RepID=A0A815U8R4_ADIRI|nr:unnamed protein product [Adineta ricciae]
MSLRLGQKFPNYTVKTTVGDKKIHQWLGDQWGILFSHPADYTPVCTTELARAAKLAPEFAKRNTKLIGLSCDTVELHREWIKDIHAYAGITDQCSEQFPFPIIDDSDRALATKLGMIDPVETDNEGIALTARSVFYIGPDKKVKAMLLYPATSGRNFDEILRLLDSLQLSAKFPIATPVDWKPGDEVMVPPNVSENTIKEKLPNGIQVKCNLPSGKGYIRTTTLQ